MPFRLAHEIVGRIVAHCLKNKKELEDLTLKEYRKFHKDFADDIRTKIKLENTINSRNHTGGTATKRVLKRIKEIEKNLDKI